MNKSQNKLYYADSLMLNIMDSDNDLEKKLKKNTNHLPFFKYHFLTFKDGFFFSFSSCTVAWNRGGRARVKDGNHIACSQQCRASAKKETLLALSQTLLVVACTLAASLALSAHETS